MRYFEKIKSLIAQKVLRLWVSPRENASVFGLMFVAVVIRLRNLDSPVTGSYTFRTTQTAWGIRSVANGVLSPFSVETPVLGPPWKIPFEFPLYQMIAGFLSRFSGLSVEASGRLVSITFFVLSGYVLYRICKMFFSVGVSLLVYAIFLFNSHNLEYGSSVLIEYCAVFFSLTGFYFALKYCQAFLKKHLILFFIFGSIAALVKITTALIWIVFGACFALFIYRAKLRSVITLLSVALSTLVPAILWTQWADDQKSKTIYTEWLTSDNLRDWNFGTIVQRLSYTDWNRTIIDIFFPSILGSSLVAVAVLVISLSFAKNIKVSLGFFALFVLGPLLFTNLYFVHDYYWTAVLPALLLSMSSAVELVSALLRRIPNFSSVKSATFGMMIGVALVMSSWFSDYGIRHFDVFIKPGSLSYNGDEYRVAIEEIQSVTSTNDKIIILGNDWDPRLLYFSNRRGLMILDRWEPMKLVNRSQLGFEYKYLYVFPPASLDLASVQQKFEGVEVEQVGISTFRFG